MVTHLTGGSCAIAVALGRARLHARALLAVADILAARRPVDLRLALRWRHRQRPGFPAPPLAPLQEAGRTALMVACKVGAVDVTSKLLAKMAAISPRDSCGKSALDYARVRVARRLVPATKSSLAEHTLYTYRR